MLPAAGEARRLGPREGSKELEPVYRGAGSSEARPVAFRLLDALAEARVPRAIVVTSAGKTDVRETLQEGRSGGGLPSIEHLVVESSPAAAFTVSVGTIAAGEHPIALGFPDVLWEGDRAFERLFAELEAGVSAVLGLFPPALDYATDGVRVDVDGRVAGFEPADRAEGMPTWTLAVWTPSFSRFLERQVAERYGPWRGETPAGELSMTQVFALALEAGLTLSSIVISDRPFLDIGEPGRLEAARAACRPPGEGGGSPTP